MPPWSNEITREVLIHFAGEVTVRVEWYEAKVLRKTTATLQELSRVSIF
jgi:hypothetical protein